ncbi:MAG: SHOCT domain-containing protein [Candidatus Hydrothermarchaeota archaeon]
MKKQYMAYIVFGVLILLLLLTVGYERGSAFFGCRYWGGMMHGMMYGHGFGFGWIIWLILLVIFIYLVLSFKEEPKEDAIDILNKRFARGEITKEEYISMKEEILKKFEE